MSSITIYIEVPGFKMIASWIIDLQHISYFIFSKYVNLSAKRADFHVEGTPKSLLSVLKLSIWELFRKKKFRNLCWFRGATNSILAPFDN